MCKARRAFFATDRRFSAAKPRPGRVPAPRVRSTRVRGRDAPDENRHCVKRSRRRLGFEAQGPIDLRFSEGIGRTLARWGGC